MLNQPLINPIRSSTQKKGSDNQKGCGWHQREKHANNAQKQEEAAEKEIDRFVEAFHFAFNYSKSSEPVSKETGIFEWTSNPLYVGMRK